MKELLLFLSSAVKNPLETGAVAPSSAFLKNEMLSRIDFENAKNIVELGPGTGAFTNSILKMSKPDAKIFCFETNKMFCSHLAGKFTDKRLVVVNDSAERISSILKKFGVQKADCVISGLPFLDFSDKKRSSILNEVKRSLRKKGKFVLFQYTSRIEGLLKSNFAKLSKSFVLINLPPAFVYECKI